MTFVVGEAYLLLLNACAHSCLAEGKLHILLTPVWATMRHVLHAPPKVPSGTEPRLPTVVNCLSIHPLWAAFPSLSHFPHTPTSASWDHLPNKPLEPKYLSQCLLLWEPNLCPGLPSQIFFNALLFIRFPQALPSLIWAFSVNIFVSCIPYQTLTLRFGPGYPATGGVLVNI